MEGNVKGETRISGNSILPGWVAAGSSVSLCAESGANAGYHGEFPGMS